VDGQSIGLVDVKIHGNEAHIENLVVLEKFRRKGVGTELLRKAVVFSKSIGVRRIRAEMPVQNTNRFYEKNGFKFAEDTFLIEVKDKKQVELYLNEKLYSEGENQYWVPSEKEMRFIGELGVDFKTVGRFQVMIRDT